MKRIIAMTLAIVCLLGLCGCNNNADSPAEHEAVSADYGKVIDLAKEEFAEVFKEFEDVQIEETTTMARTDDAKEIVVQFKYSSSNGNGLYGFLYTVEEKAHRKVVYADKQMLEENIVRKHTACLIVDEEIGEISESTTGIGTLHTPVAEPSENTIRRRNVLKT